MKSRCDRPGISFGDCTLTGDNLEAICGPNGGLTCPHLQSRDQDRSRVMMMLE